MRRTSGSIATKAASLLPERLNLRFQLSVRLMDALTVPSPSGKPA